MRLSFAYFWIALLIAVFAIGAPIAARADCVTCEGCAVEVPTNNRGPCSEQAPACKLAPNCAGQLQYMLGQMAIGIAEHMDKTAFGFPAHPETDSASVTPETAPPRL